MGPEVIELVRGEDWSRVDALGRWPAAVIAGDGFDGVEFDGDGLGGDGFGGDRYGGDKFDGDGFGGDGFGTGGINTFGSRNNDVKELLDGPFCKRLSILSIQLPTSACWLRASN